MSYLCPVCESPFGGSEPLADHLAVTAILHGGDHEAWLDDTVDDWDSLSRAALGERVVDHAETTDDHEHIGDHEHVGDHSHGEPELASGLPNGIDAAGAGQHGGALDGDATALDTDAQALDADAQAIIDEARELTREMHDEDEQ